MGIFGGHSRGVSFQHTRMPRASRHRPGRCLALEPLETRTLLDAASLNPHGMFPGEMFPVGEYADDMVLADFNEDGDLDVAVTGRFTNDAAVRLGNGDGTLAQQVRFATGLRPYSIAAADLDSDGHIDLVTGNFSSITLLLGHGDGTFEAESLPLPGTEFWDVEVADVNEDGAVDVVAAAYTEGSLFVLPGRGDRTFGDCFELAVGEGVLDVSLNDLNDDGHLDIITANALDNSVSVLLGEGEGDFQAETRYEVGQYPGSLELADYNKDGWTDLFVANFQDDNISVFVGTGDGRFMEETQYAAIVPRGPFPHDFDGDGDLDLLMPVFGENNLTVLLNQNDGTFAHGERVPSGSSVQKIIAGDMNSDGRDDLTVLCWGANSVAIHLAREDGSFQFPVYHAVDREPQSVVLADFNMDGHLDVASANTYVGPAAHQSSISVRLGQGNGTFGDEYHYPVATYIRSPVVGDFNEDGFCDLAAPSGNLGIWSLLFGQGDGTFEVLTYETGEQTRSLAAGDFDNDGHLDLIGIVDDTNSPSASFSLHRGNGSGGFQFTYNRLLTSQQAPEPSAMVSDLNADGYADLVVAPVDGQILVFGGRGDGTFNDPERYCQDILPTSVALGNFNEDTRTDIFGLEGESLVVLLNRGDGGYDTLVGASTDSWRAASTVTDFNRDGHADVACYVNNPSQVQIYLGYGDGTFTQPAEYATGGVVYPLGYFMAVGDLNEDGWDDLVLPDEWNNSVSVSLQKPRASFTLGGASRVVTGEDGGTASFEVTLDNRPTANVTIHLSSSDTTEGTVSPASLTFTPENWSTPQIVTVTGIDDDQIDGPVAFSILVDPTSSEDPVYAAAARQNAQVVNIDDELSVDPLGVIDFRRLKGLDLTGGVLGFSFQTVRSGFLTAEISAQAANELVELALFDADRVERPLVCNGSSTGKVRVEWPVEEGREYVLLVSGSDEAAGLCIANLVERDGSRVTVHGTDGNDVCSFSAAAACQVIVNGLVYTFDPAEVDKVMIDGAGGGDRLEMFDSLGDDALRRTSDFVSLAGPSYQAEAVGFETTIVHSRAGGFDVAQLDVSQEIGAFVGTPTWSELTGEAYTFRAEGFEAVHGYWRGGGNTAVLHGSAGNDKWKSYDNQTLLRAVDSSYLVRTKFFEKVSVDAGPGGTDTAIFYDSFDDDDFHFDGRKLTSRIRGSGRDEHVATGFPRVAVYGGEGHDTAHLTGSSGLAGEETNVFYLRSHKSQLAAEGLDVAVRGYDTVCAEADQRGFDVARIYETAGDDHLEVSGNTARLYRRNGDALELLYEAIAVERVKAYRTTGNDTKDIQDHTLDLLLYGWDEE